MIIQYPEIEIIKETDDYLVINKPAGMIVHGLKNGQKEEGSLVAWLLGKYPSIRNVGEDPSRPGIVHRLDREVSGLMVVAKNNASFQSLKEQFQLRQTHKAYVGLVYGKMLRDDGEINFPIKRSEAGFKMAAVPENYPVDEDKVRRASTEFSIRKRFINYTLLDLSIKTGRTHQIRVHLFAVSHPLVGDNLYATKTTRQKNSKIDLGRIFLVSSRLEFKDLNGENQFFEIGLPRELEVFLTKIK